MADRKIVLRDGMIVEDTLPVLDGANDGVRERSANG
jgi:hypothetical protein